MSDSGEVWKLTIAAERVVPGLRQAIEQAIGLSAENIYDDVGMEAHFYFDDREAAEDAADLIQSEFRELEISVRPVALHAGSSSRRSSRPVFRKATPVERLEILEDRVEHFNRAMKRVGGNPEAARALYDAEEAAGRSRFNAGRRRRRPAHLGCGADAGQDAGPGPAYVKIMRPGPRGSLESRLERVASGRPKRRRGMMTTRIVGPYAIISARASGTTPAAQDYISRKMSKLRGEGYPQKQAIAIALSMARREGYKV